jgi:NTE family protein
VAWGELIFDERGVATNLIEKVGRPILRLAKWHLDLPAIALGMLPFVNAANIAAEAYDRVLFRRATLQELPESPRFVFNATSLQTGSLWRFSREYAAEYRVGHWAAPDLRLAVAVGASAAFPPFLSPVSIRLGPEVMKPFEGADLSCAPFTRKLLLTDGGVYDNLGLEPVWKRYRTLLVSDGGLVTPAKRRPRTDWLSQPMRAADISLQQGNQYAHQGSPRPKGQRRARGRALGHRRFGRRVHGR